MNMADMQDNTSPTTGDNQVAALREILEHLVSHFAEKDEKGEWWGFDTNVGKRTQDFAAAIRSIRGQNLYKRQTKLKLKYYKELKVDRGKIAIAIWGDKIPAWWKGSRGEWDVLEAITEVTGLVTERRKPTQSTANPPNRGEDGSV